MKMCIFAGEWEANVSMMAEEKVYFRHSRACMENINKFLAQMTKGDSELYFGRSIFSWVMRAHILGRRVHIVNVLANLY